MKLLLQLLVFLRHANVGIESVDLQHQEPKGNRLTHYVPNKVFLVSKPFTFCTGNPTKTDQHIKFLVRLSRDLNCRHFAPGAVGKTNLRLKRRIYVGIESAEFFHQEPKEDRFTLCVPGQGYLSNPLNFCTRNAKEPDELLKFLEKSSGYPIHRNSAPDILGMID